VFEFLGYLWIPILVNFFEIIFVIFGFFGVYQYRPKYIISYSLWHVFWLGWNIFVICLYLDLGLLNHKENLVLKLDRDSESWWIKNGPGCKGVLNTTNGVPKMENFTDCLLDYRYVEVFQAGMQAVLALLGVITGTCLSRTFLEEDDSFNYMSGDGKGVQHLALQPMYVEIDRVPSYTALNSSLKSNRKSLASVRSSCSNNDNNSSMSYSKDAVIQLHTFGSANRRSALKSFGQY